MGTSSIGLRYAAPDLVPSLSATLRSAFVSFLRYAACVTGWSPGAFGLCWAMRHPA